MHKGLRSTFVELPYGAVTVAQNGQTTRVPFAFHVFEVAV